MLPSEVLTASSKSLCQNYVVAVFFVSLCRVLDVVLVIFLYTAVTRGHKSWMRNYYISLHKRRLDQGPEPERPRSVWANW